MSEDEEKENESACASSGERQNPPIEMKITRSEPVCFGCGLCQSLWRVLGDGSMLMRSHDSRSAGPNTPKSI